MSNISPLASIDPAAILADNVSIGPFCCIGPHVTIGAGTVLTNNVTVAGHTTIGEHNQIYAGAALGGPPQDLAYGGTSTRLVIGDHNVIRENVTINCASEKEQGLTKVGNRCYLMANCHVAHDCRLGDRIVLTNGVMLAGHVHVHDDVTIGGGAGVHHYATIGSYAFVGGLARVAMDIPPYMLCEGHPARPRCINIVALKRNDFAQHVIKALQEAHRLIFRGKVRLDEARETLRAGGHLVPQVTHLLTFLETQQEGQNGRGRERLRRMAA